MREYKIYKTDLWYAIYRKKHIGKLIMIQYLDWHNKRELNKGCARTFYNLNDATSALILARVRWKTPITSTKKSESEEEWEKKSWSEL